MKRLAPILLAMAGCLEVPDAPTPECSTTADCNGSEVCEDGTCWGDPPAGDFAIVISPPAERTELLTREIMQVPISADGRIQGLSLLKPVSLTGQLDAMCTPPTTCDGRMLMANVTITRPSLFAGGPGFRTVVTSTATSDIPTFTVSVPPGDEQVPYTVTIVPMPRGDSPPTGPASLAESVPPMRYQLPLVGNTTKRLTIGGVTLPSIDGTLLDSYGGGLEDYRVVAMGRWEAGAAATEVSTVAYTGSNGAFRLTLSPDLVGPVELVARPSDSSSGKPTLHLLNVASNQFNVTARTMSEPGNLGNMVTRTIHLKGKATAGAVKDIAGARVRVTAIVGTAQAGTAVFFDEETTNESGNVQLQVREGATYRLDIVPPASSDFGAIYDYPLDTNLDIQLPLRTRLTGTVRDANGDKLVGATITARPSLPFVWALDEVPQTFLNAIPASTDVTGDKGEYVVYVDPLIAEVWGRYDIAVDPARSSTVLERTPTFVQPDVELPRDASLAQITVPDIWLPDAAFVHGMVLDYNQQPVPNAEVKIFRMNSYISSLCESLPNAPVPCPVPAELLGRGVADKDGVVELTLPR